MADNRVFSAKPRPPRIVAGRAILP